MDGLVVGVDGSGRIWGLDCFVHVIRFFLSWAELNFLCKRYAGYSYLNIFDNNAFKKTVELG